MEITTESNIVEVPEEEEESVWSFDLTSSEFSGSIKTSVESASEKIARE